MEKRARNHESHDAAYPPGAAKTKMAERRTTGRMSIKKSTVDFANHEILEKNENDEKPRMKANERGLWSTAPAASRSVKLTGALISANRRQSSKKSGYTGELVIRNKHGRGQAYDPRPSAKSAVFRFYSTSEMCGPFTLVLRHGRARRSRPWYFFHWKSSRGVRQSAVSNTNRSICRIPHSAFWTLTRRSAY